MTYDPEPVVTIYESVIGDKLAARRICGHETTHKLIVDQRKDGSFEVTVRPRSTAVTKI